MANTQTVPVHLGLILDGNRRWAKQQGLPIMQGHRKGYENLVTIGRAALKRGIKYISVYAFSTENWQRAREEVDYLMGLFLWVAKSKLAELHREDIRVRFLGSQAGLSTAMLKAIAAAEEKTRHNTGGTLAVCLNYGGQQELVDATQKIVDAKTKNVTADSIEQNLYAPDIPPIDLIIRTGGEKRLSNFMLWRAAYSELHFTDKYWPAFSPKDLDAALEDYAKRQRRFGK